MSVIYALCTAVLPDVSPRVWCTLLLLIYNKSSDRVASNALRSARTHAGTEFDRGGAQICSDHDRLVLGSTRQTCAEDDRRARQTADSQRRGQTFVEDS